MLSESDKKLIFLPNLLKRRSCKAQVTNNQMRFSKEACHFGEHESLKDIAAEEAKIINDRVSARGGIAWSRQPN